MVPGLWDLSASGAAYSYCVHRWAKKLHFLCGNSCYWVNMEDIVGAFVAAPSEGFLDQCTKDQLVSIAQYYGFEVGDKRVKD